MEESINPVALNPTHRRKYTKKSIIHDEVVFNQYTHFSLVPTWNDVGFIEGYVKKAMELINEDSE